MKLVCGVIPTYYVPQLGIAAVESYGLTIGKVYDGQPVAIGANGNSIRFLVYNDNGEWALYDKRLFKPE